MAARPHSLLFGSAEGREELVGEKLGNECKNSCWVTGTDRAAITSDIHTRSGLVLSLCSVQALVCVSFKSLDYCFDLQSVKRLETWPVVLAWVFVSRAVVSSSVECNVCQLHVKLYTALV